MSYPEEATFTHEDWMDDGSCRADNVDPDWWSSGDTQVIRHAKSICAECPVKKDCFEWAQRTRVKWVIAGEKTADERKALRRGV